MEKIKSWMQQYRIVLCFALAKLVVHLLTATHYGFQRDAYLYLAQSRHLDWGFFSTPPLLAFITRIHTSIWGDSVLAVRLLPALVGAVSMFIVGWLIKQLKGGTMAQVMGLTAYFAFSCLSATGGLPATRNLQPSVLAAGSRGGFPAGSETGSQVRCSG